MSNVVWAMATLQRRSTRLCEAIAEEALKRGMSVFAPQAISNMVWGFAVLDYNHPAFMKASSMPCMLPQSVCMVAGRAVIDC